ncbi:MAG TPA: DNA repair exonuclease [Thermoguttaceae bacterium]|nr:DNA repair exonuclease [Thermoguttaceae bacterium]HPP51407.1 DNA repair exonuclease [Thermoguttaceae bacterium]
MAGTPFCFLHASDFHLEQPGTAGIETPEPLREAMLESPYRAAERVVDLALAHQAAFVVLAGDILDPTWTGPRGPLFLREQFRRLADAGVTVYWVGGRCDPPELWPSLLRLPDNVRRFSRSRPEVHLHEQGGAPIARVVGAVRHKKRRVRPRDFRQSPAEVPTIAVVYGRTDPEKLHVEGIDYWALGGRHRRSTFRTSPEVVHYPGTPQGRGPEEPGAHGCTLVWWHPERGFRLAFFAADGLRWQTERIPVHSRTNREALETLLRGRVHALRQSAPMVDWMVDWVIVGEGPLVDRLRRGRLAAELLEQLRREFAQEKPFCWSNSLRVSQEIPKPAETEGTPSLRDVFLRLVQQRQNETETVDLSEYAEGSSLAGQLGSILSVEDPRLQNQLWQESALLGADLLEGEGMLGM